MSQNAADKNSALTCDPECPQEEYVYDYQYADSADNHNNNNNNNNNEVIEDNIIEDNYQPDYYSEELQPVNAPPTVEENEVYDYPDEEPVYDIDTSYDAVEVDDNSVYTEEDYNIIDDAEEADDEVKTDSSCPGGDLESCVDVCPGQFGARVFGLCVGSCGKRCP